MNNNLLKPIFTNTKLQFALCFLAWVFVNLFWINNKGVFAVNEAEKYIFQADLLKSGQWLNEPSFIGYLLPIGLIAICKKIGIGLVGVVIVQWLLSLLLMYLIYAITNVYFGKTRAFIACLLYACCLPLQEFNVYIYSEALFFFFGFLSTYFLLKHNRTSSKSYIWYWLLAIIACLLCRPTSIAFLVTGVFYFAYFFFSKLKHKTTLFYVSISIGLIGTAIFTNWLMQIGKLFDFMLPFEEGRFICGTINSNAVPDNLKIPADRNSLWSIISFAFNNPGYFLKACGYKLFSFFGMWRVQYTSAHNWANIIYCYPIFIIAFYKIWLLFKQNKGWFIIITTPIICTTLIVFFTCDDYGNRFILPLFPLFFMAAVAKKQQPS
jgi:hypothetical protein